MPSTLPGGNHQVGRQPRLTPKCGMNGSSGCSPLRAFTSQPDVTSSYNPNKRIMFAGWRRTRLLTCPSLRLIRWTCHIQITPRWSSHIDPLTTCGPPTERLEKDLENCQVVAMPGSGNTLEPCKEPWTRKDANGAQIPTLRQTIRLLGAPASSAVQCGRRPSVQKDGGWSFHWPKRPLTGAARSSEVGTWLPGFLLGSQPPHRS